MSAAFAASEILTTEAKGTEATESWPAPLLLINTLVVLQSLLRSITQTVARLPKSQMLPCSAAYDSSSVTDDTCAVDDSLCRDSTKKASAESNEEPPVSRLAGALGSNLNAS